MKTKKDFDTGETNKEISNNTLNEIDGKLFSYFELSHPKVQAYGRLPEVLAGLRVNHSTTVSMHTIVNNKLYIMFSSRCFCVS